MYAIIKTGGKQYRVHEGDIIYVEKLKMEDGATLELDVLLLQDDTNAIKVGKPLLDDVHVTAKVLGQVKGEKITVFKYKAKKNQRKKQGHRQPYTRLEISSIKA